MDIFLWIVTILFIFVGLSLVLFLGGMIVAMLMVPCVSIAERFWPSADQAARNEAEKVVQEAFTDGRASLDCGAQRAGQSHRDL